MMVRHSKHPELPITPGPWAWDWEHSGNLYRKSDLDRMRAEIAAEKYDGDYVEAIVQTDMRQYGPNDADARLIAAAPSMLDALRKAESALREMGDSYAIQTKSFDGAAHLIENANLDALNAIRAAIAEVEGR